MKIGDLQSSEDYKGFLLTYLAEADYRVTDEEKEIIFQHVSPDKYTELKALIDRLSDFECLNVIGDYREKFLTNETVLNELIQEMEDIYTANKHRSVLEQNMILALKKVLS